MPDDIYMKWPLVTYYKYKHPLATYYNMFVFRGCMHVCYYCAVCNMQHLIYNRIGPKGQSFRAENCHISISITRPLDKNV